MKLYIIINVNHDSDGGYDMDTGLLQEIMKAARGAGEIMMSAGREKGVVSKEGRANFVTAYDEKVQDYLFTALSKLLPEAHFVGEEEGKEGSGREGGRERGRKG